MDGVDPVTPIMFFGACMIGALVFIMIFAWPRGCGVLFGLLSIVGAGLLAFGPSTLFEGWQETPAEKAKDVTGVEESLALGDDVLLIVGLIFIALLLIFGLIGGVAYGSRSRGRRGEYHPRGGDGGGDGGGGGGDGGP